MHVWGIRSVTSFSLVENKQTKLNSHGTLSRETEPGPHCWKANAASISIPAPRTIKLNLKMKSKFCLFVSLFVFWEENCLTNSRNPLGAKEWYLFPSLLLVSHIILYILRDAMWSFTVYKRIIKLTSSSFLWPSYLILWTVRSLPSSVRR